MLRDADAFDAASLKGLANLMADIFISYSHEDRLIAESLVRFLEAQDWSVWWDSGNRNGTHSISTKIKTELQAAIVVIVIWSKHAEESWYVDLEIKHAAKNKKYFIPVGIDQIDGHFYFGDTLVIGFPQKNGSTEHAVYSKFSEGFLQIISALKSYINVRKTSHGTLNEIYENSDKIFKRPDVYFSESEGLKSAINPTLGFNNLKDIFKFVKEVADYGTPEALSHDEYKVALEIIERAAHNGNHQAEAILGELYHTGKGVEQNFDKAFEFLHRSAEGGHTDAQYYLGRLYAQERHSASEYAEAIKWLRAASNRNHPDAQYYIGYLLLTEETSEHNEVEAAHYFRMSAKQNHAEAQFQLGMLHSRSVSVGFDYIKSMEYFFDAAIQGHKEAQYRLGIQLVDGPYADRNYPEGMQWLHKAAEQDHQEALDRIKEENRAQDKASFNKKINQGRVRRAEQST